MKKLIGMLGLLAMILILGGCRLLEEHRANQKLDYYAEVYPTENMSDLFDKFPNGFEFYRTESKIIDNQFYFYQIEIKTQEDTRELVGTYTVKNLSKTPSEKIVDFPIKYEENVGFVPIDEENTLPESIANWKILMTFLSLEEVKKEGLKFVSITKHPLSSAYSIKFEGNSVTIRNTLNIQGDVEVEVRGMESTEIEGKYQSTISIENSDGLTSISESILEK